MCDRNRLWYGQIDRDLRKYNSALDLPVLQDLFASMIYNGVQCAGEANVVRPPRS